jgi:hypothetical protein
MIRVRQGDTIDLTFEVPDDENRDVHNVDFHAVYGPGGGAKATTIALSYIVSTAIAALLFLRGTWVQSPKLS